MVVILKDALIRLSTVFLLLRSTEGGSPLLHSTEGGSPRRYNALWFWHSPHEFVYYKQPDMSPFTTEFTVCAWIKKLQNHLALPTWFSYYLRSSPYEITMTDEGKQTRTFNSNADVRSEFSVAPGAWFHTCVSWSNATASREVYVNGELVNTLPTPPGRVLKQGGAIVLGSMQKFWTSPQLRTQTIMFGGEIYKLNMFSTKLEQSLIQEMARDRCSDSEETYAHFIGIRWEDFLVQSRFGNIVEYKTDCGYIKELKSAGEELAKTKLEKGNCRYNLGIKEQQLNRTVLQLERTESDLNSTVDTLNSTETELLEKETRLKETAGELKRTLVELQNVSTTLNQTQFLLKEATSSSYSLSSTLTLTAATVYMILTVGGDCFHSNTAML